MGTVPGESALHVTPVRAVSSATARVTALPVGMKLNQALLVTCTTQIEPFESWLWKMTLTASWTAGSGHSEGSDVTILWLSADGALRGIYSPQDQSAIPYTQ